MGTIPAQAGWGAPPLSLQHPQDSFLLSNYHQQASAAVCIPALMSRSSSQRWLELGRRNVSAEIAFLKPIRSTGVLKLGKGGGSAKKLK